MDQLPSAGLSLGDLFGEDVAITNPFDDQFPTFPAQPALPASTEAAKVAQEAPQEDVTMHEAQEEHDAELFGSDDEMADSPAPADAPAQLPSPKAEDEDEEQLSETEQARRQELEYPEPEGDPTSTEEKVIADISLLANPVPAQSKVWHARLPNFLALETKAFDDATWEPPTVGEEVEDGEEGERKPPVPDENVIRWRWGVDAQGKPIPQANSRIVEWSDGSLSLQVGTELFDITAALDNSAPITSTFPTTAPKAPTNESGTPSLTEFDPARGHGLTFLTANTSHPELMEAQASIYGTLTFRPTTLQSKTHRLLAGNIAGRYVKGRAMKQALTSEDPERKKAEMEKAETEKARKLAKAKSGSKSSGRRNKRATRVLGLSDEDEEEEEGEEGGAGGRRSNPKRGRGGVLSREDVSESEDDDGFVVDSDAEENTGRRRADSGDEMEFMEAQLDRDAERRKAQKKRREQGRAESPVEPVQVPKRRLVIESDEDE